MFRVCLYCTGDGVTGSTMWRARRAHFALKRDTTKTILQFGRGVKSIMYIADKPMKRDLSVCVTLKTEAQRFGSGDSRDSGRIVSRRDICNIDGPFSRCQSLVSAIWAGCRHPATNGRLGMWWSYCKRVKGGRVEVERVHSQLSQISDHLDGVRHAISTIRMKAA